MHGFSRYINKYFNYKKTIIAYFQIRRGHRQHRGQAQALRPALVGVGSIIGKFWRIFWERKVGFTSAKSTFSHFNIPDYISEMNFLYAQEHSDR